MRYGADQQADQQRGEGSKCSADREVAKDAECVDVDEQLLIKKPVEQMTSALPGFLDVPSRALF